MSNKEILEDVEAIERRLRDFFRSYNQDIVHQSVAMLVDLRAKLNKKPVRSVLRVPDPTCVH